MFILESIWVLIVALSFFRFLPQLALLYHAYRYGYAHIRRSWDSDFFTLGGLLYAPWTTYVFMLVHNTGGFDVSPKLIRKIFVLGFVALDGAYTINLAMNHEFLSRFITFLTPAI